MDGFKFSRGLTFSFLSQIVPVGSQLRKSNICARAKAVGSVCGGSKSQEFRKGSQFVYRDQEELEL